MTDPNHEWAGLPQPDKLQADAGPSVFSKVRPRADHRAEYAKKLVPWLDEPLSGSETAPDEG